MQAKSKAIIEYVLRIGLFLILNRCKGTHGLIIVYDWFDYFGKKYKNFI